MESIKKIFRTPTAFVLLLVAIFSLIGVIIQNKSAETIARIPIDATLTAEAKLTENANSSGTTQILLGTVTMLPQSTPTATLPLPPTPRLTATVIPGWEGHQGEYNLNETISYFTHTNFTDGHEHYNVKKEIDLDANSPYSLMEKAIITEIKDLMYCSNTFLENNDGECPDPSSDNDTQIIKNAWMRNGNVITWILPFPLASDMAISVKIKFMAKADVVHDGDLIHVNATTYADSQSSSTQGQLYVIRVP